MKYTLEIKTNNGVKEYKFYNKEDAQSFINNLSTDEIENIVTCYKYDDDDGFQAWDDFIFDDNSFVCPQCGYVIKINDRTNIVCECGCNAHINRRV